MRSKISASPRTSSCAVGSSSSTTPAPSSHGAQRARQRDALPLAAGEIGAAVVAAREHRVERRRASPRRPPRARRGSTSSGAPAGATLSRSGSSKRMKSWNTAVDARAPRRRGRARAGRRRRPRSRRPAGRRAGTAAWRASSCRRRSGRRSRATIPAGIVRSKPSSTGAPPRVGEGDVAEADLARRHARRPARSPDGSAPAGAIAGSRRSTAATGAAAPSSAQFRPPNAIIDVPTALCAKTTTRAESRARRRRRRSPSDQKTTTLAPTTSSRLQSTGCSRSRVASYCSSCRRVRRATKRSIVQPARPNSRSSLAGRRIDGEAVGVVGVALRGAHLVGVAVAPDARSRAAASASPATRRRARSAPTRRTPTSTTARRDAADHLDQPAGDEVHRDRQRRAGHAEVEVARDGEVAGELRDPRGGPCPAAARTPRSAGRRATPRCGRRGWR